MPKSGEHKVNYIDSFFRQRPSINSVREGETISFLEDGKLIKQEKRNGVVYQSEFAEAIPKLSTDEVETGVIREIIAGTGLTGGGFSGEITLNVVGGTGITANANDIAIDSTVATLTGTQTLSNKTLASPTFTGTAQGANLTLTGDLTVGGTTTTLNAQNLQVKDKNIVLNYLDGDASSTADGAGITIQDAVNSITDATILWDNSSPTNSPGEFDFSHSINVTGNISLSGTVDGRDIATDGSKLDGIEALADVTDTTNVTAAGALMDSEVDADIKTLSLPASTTISSFAKTYLDDGDTTTFQSTIFGTTDVALGGQEKPRVVTLDYKTDSLTAIGSGDNFIIIDASDNYNLKVANFPTVLGTTGAINANEFARFTNSTTLEALTAAETVTALGLDDVPTVSSGSNDRIATFTGTSALQGESNLTFNSSNVLYVNGSVGIGATSPSASLEISKAGGEYLDLDISGISSGTSKLRFLDGGTAKFELRHFAGSPLLDANLSVYDHNTSSEALTVQVGGNVGIGTNSPSSKLHINGSSNGAGIVTSISNSYYAAASTDEYVQYQGEFYQNDVAALRAGGYIRIGKSGDFSNNANASGHLVFATRNAGTLAERMRIDQSGNVIMQPTKKLYLDGGSDTYITETSADLVDMYVGAEHALRIADFGNTPYVYVPDNAYLGAGSGIDFSIRHDETNTYITNSTGDMNFVERDAGNINFRNNSGTSHLYIKTGGNVGIGTQSPASKLHIFNGDGSIPDDANNHLLIEDDGHSYLGIGGGTSSDTGIHFMDSGGIRGRIAYKHSSDAMDFKTANAVAMTINSSQNVGIGTDSPSVKLHINDNDVLIGNNSSGYATLNFHSATTGSARYASIMKNYDSPFDMRIRASNSTAEAPLVFDGDSNTEYARFDTSGNFGIGTTDPSSLDATGNRLVIGGGSGDEGLTIFSGTTGRGTMLFADGNDGSNAEYRGWIQYEHANDSLEFATASAEKMRIDSSGNVGIATQSPGAKLDVKSQINVTNANNNSLVGLKGTNFGFSTSYRVVQVGNTSGNESVSIGYDPSGNSSGAFTGDGREVLFRNGVEFTTPNSANNGFHNDILVLKDGLVGIGTASPDSKLEVSSSGVTAVKITGSYPILYFEDVETGAYIANNANGLFIGKTNSPSTANDILKLDLTYSKLVTAGGYFEIGGGSTIPGILGFNRNISTGAIHNGSYGAYQMQNEGGTFRIQVYNSSGGSVNANAFVIKDTANVGIGTASPVGNLDVVPDTDGYSRIGRARVGYVGFADYAGFSHIDRANVSQYAMIQQSDGATFINSASGTPIYFRESNATKMILTGGNVGIGVASPSAKLDVAGNIEINNSSDPTLTFQEGSLTKAQIVADNEGSAGGSLEFFTRVDGGSSTEKMRISAAGNVGIGTNSPGAKFTVLKDGTQAASVSTTYQIQTVSNSNGGIAIQAGDSSIAYLVFGDNGDYDAGRIAYKNSSHDLCFYTNNAEEMVLDSDGDLHVDRDVVAFSTTPSDKRLKKNIKDIDYGLDTIMKLSPKEYDWKKDDTHDIGFIAQEVEEIIPEIVKNKKHFDKDIKTLDYEKLTAVLIKAVQEQQQQINKLEEKLNG